jgi:uncharacterized protein
MLRAHSALAPKLEGRDGNWICTMGARVTITVVRNLLALLLCVSAAHAAPIPGPDSGNGERRPGKFIWFELVTDDFASASAFYQSVFGWRFLPLPGAPASYTLVQNDGTRVAGMFVHEPGKSSARGARWLTLISVPDVSAAAHYAVKHGGGIVSAPARIEGRGTHALLRDPEGALFGVLRTQSGDPPDTPVEDGDFFWIDLFAREPGRAAAFYSGLAGYEISQRESNAGFTRLVLQSQGFARAGIVPRPAELKQSGWLAYVLVGDVASTLAKVAAAQGKVLVKPDPKLLDGNVAVIADPLGGVLGIVNWQAEARSATGADR